MPFRSRLPHDAPTCLPTYMPCRTGTDPVTVSRRLGHGSPVVTMAVYAHLFDRGDEGAAESIDALLRIGEN
jgi:hypothetical protein